MDRVKMLNTIEEQVDILAETIQKKELQEYIHGEFLSLIQAVIFKKKQVAVEMGLDAMQILFHMPTAMFWAKMERYLRGSFLSFEDQIKFSMKFSEDNENYKNFVKKQINLINNIEADSKVDYLANLTRCFFLFDMDVPLYFRLARIIENCTSEELDFLRDVKLDAMMENNAMVSMLIIQGIIVQTQNENDNTRYMISSFGELLKKCSLNFESEGWDFDGSLRYKEINGIPQIEPISIEDVDMLNRQS